MIYLSALDVCSRRSAIQIHVQGCEFEKNENFPRKISGNLLKIFFHFILFNYNHITKNKHVLDKQLSRFSCFNFMHYVQNQKKIICIQHCSQKYQRIRIKIIDLITSRLQTIFPEISGKFPEILNFRKIHNPIHVYLYLYLYLTFVRIVYDQGCRLN